MSGISKRTVYYDNTGGYVRFWDWATCTTALGAMAEPFELGHYAFHKTRAYDPTDDCVRIDDVRAAPFDKHQMWLSGGMFHLNGGVMMPRVGR